MNFHKIYACVGSYIELSESEIDDVVRHLVSRVKQRNDAFAKVFEVAERRNVPIERSGAFFPFASDTGDDLTELTREMFQHENPSLDLEKNPNFSSSFTITKYGQEHKVSVLVLFA